MAAMYNPPVITVQIGRMVEAGQHTVDYTLTGTDHQAISRALDRLDFTFDYIVQASGIVVFRGPNAQKAWYHQVYNRLQTDHNSEEINPA